MKNLPAQELAARRCLARWLHCSTRTFALSAAAVLVGALAGAGCHTTVLTVPRAASPGGQVMATLPVISAAPQGLPLAPDLRLTPGAVLPVTRDDICVPGYSQKVRNVPEAVKRQAYAEYGITTHKAGDFEVDHLISLELGGSNSLKNLWPESYKTQPWNAHVKDKLENRLHADVCSNKIPLATAQQEIATDWIGSYKRIFNTSLPLAKGGGRRGHGRSHSRAGQSTISAMPAAPFVPSASGQVWVNTHSHKYFRPGSPYYGHTKAGAFMSEQAALKAGNLAAKGQ